MKGYESMFCCCITNYPQTQGHETTPLICHFSLAWQSGQTAHLISASVCSCYGSAGRGGLSHSCQPGPPSRLACWASFSAWSPSSSQMGLLIQQQCSQRVKAEASGLLEAKARKSLDVISATFCWLKQVNKSAQIQGSGQVDSSF